MYIVCHSIRVFFREDSNYEKAIKSPPFAKLDNFPLVNLYGDKVIENILSFLVVH